jgi:DNA-binding NarL/FixJ family response regulator
MVRVFHCDDSAAYRALIRAELEGDAEIEIVGGASSVRGAIGDVAQARPDVVLLDLLDTTGDAVGALTAAAPGARVIVLSGHPREYGEPRRAGAVAYVEKSAPLSELRATVLRAAGG